MPRRTIRLILVAMFMSSGCASRAPCPAPAASAASGPSDAPASLDSDAGRALLAANANDPDLAPLLAHFESQQHRAHCGVASSVIALNTLHVDAESPVNLAPYRYHTQATFFDRAEVSAVVPAERVAEHGMTLDQLGGLLAASGLATTVTHGADVDVDSFRARIRANLDQPGDLVLLNYHRPGVGQEGGGHISPLAAYDEATDRVLVLDVARYRYPPMWFATSRIWEATQGIDSDSGLSRGIVEVSRRP